MGQQASKPGPTSTKMQVLALGMPRTGTSSMSSALEILLDGPSYHGGAQMLASSIPHMRRWIDIHRISIAARESGTPLSFVEHQRLRYLLAQQFEGFASCSDTPAFYYAAELAALYPDAKVIVTVRDKDRWWKSKLEFNDTRRRKWLPWIVWPIPAGVRYWPGFGKTLLRGPYADIYLKEGETGVGPEAYDRHIAYLERVVPKERLYYFHVKDGWGPLCKILEREVPGIPFPHLNESGAIQSILDEKVNLGLWWWAILLGTIAVILSLAITVIRSLPRSTVN